MVTITSHDQNLIEDIIKQCKECFVGMVDTDMRPYVIPMNFGYCGGQLYLHSAPTGMSVSCLEKNNRVCVTFCTPSTIVHQDQQVACSYRVRASSVICEGSVEFIDDSEQKKECLNVLMKHYTDKEFTYSEPAVQNVKVWKVSIEKMTAKIFGVPYKDRLKYMTLD